MKYKDVSEVLSRVSDTTEFLGIDLVDVNQAGIFGNTPLAVVITWGDYEAASKLIEGGADVNARIENNETALHRAVQFDSPSIVELLLNGGADIGLKDVFGATPLDDARRLDDEIILELLRFRP